MLLLLVVVGRCSLLFACSVVTVIAGMVTLVFWRGVGAIDEAEIFSFGLVVLVRGGGHDLNSPDSCRRVLAETRSGKAALGVLGVLSSVMMQKSGVWGLA